VILVKKIECVVRPEKVKELVDALRLVGVGGMTITEVKGFGKETTRPESYLILPKTKIEIYAAAAQVDEIVDTVIKTCNTGSFGDGKIAVVSLDEVIRIRTQEKGEEAIY
jgi:nitrogen regulatory protein P-II 1